MDIDVHLRGFALRGVVHRAEQALLMRGQRLTDAAQLRPQSVFRNCKLRMGPKPLGPGTDAPKRSFRGAYDCDSLPPPLSDGPDGCPVAPPGAAADAQYRARP